MTRPSNIGTLARIGLKPGATLRDRLTIARRVLRTLCAEREAIHNERHALRRKANQLRRHLPFTRLAVERLEQQAGDHRGEDSKRGPLFEACYAAFCHFIIHAPEGSLPDPFGPNGPLYGVPVRVLNPDGTETVKRPDLVVHDADGSRVVKR